MPLRIEALTADDWPEVRAICEEGLVTGAGSFEVVAPSWEQWNVARLPHSRFVAREASIAGWAALSPVSQRACYSGVAEVAICGAAAARGTGVGRALPEAIIASSETRGIRTLQGAGLQLRGTRPVRHYRNDADFALPDVASGLSGATACGITRS